MKAHTACMIHCYEAVCVYLGPGSDFLGDGVNQVTQFLQAE